MSTRDLPARMGDLPAIGRPATAALRAKGVTTLAQCAARPRSSLAALHGVGPVALRRLDAALAERDLRFQPED
ncbi:MAG: hypothetical protein ACTJHU_03935 [Mycetocola sp.]